MGCSLGRSSLGAPHVRVLATGQSTEFGRTAALADAAPLPSHFQQTIFAIGRYLIVIALALVTVIIAVSLVGGTGVARPAGPRDSDRRSTRSRRPLACSESTSVSPAPRTARKRLQQHHPPRAMPRARHTPAQPAAPGVRRRGDVSQPTQSRQAAPVPRYLPTDQSPPDLCSRRPHLDLQAIYRH